MFSTNWIPDSLNLHSFDDTMCVAYTNYNLLKGAVRVKEVKHPFVIPGLSSFNKDSLTRNCILALSFTFFGQQHSSTTITRKGTSLYGSSLTELNRLLRDPVESRTMETFEAIMVMTLYEVSNDQFKKLCSECEGCCALLYRHLQRLPTSVRSVADSLCLATKRCKDQWLGQPLLGLGDIVQNVWPKAICKVPDYYSILREHPPNDRQCLHAES